MQYVYTISAAVDENADHTVPSKSLKSSKCRIKVKKRK